MVTGLRAKGWGSTMLRAKERIMVRTGVAEGIFWCLCLYELTVMSMS
jgi:hypothetical protein